MTNDRYLVRMSNEVAARVTVEINNNGKYLIYLGRNHDGSYFTILSSKLDNLINHLEAREEFEANLVTKRGIDSIVKVLN